MLRIRPAIVAGAAALISVTSCSAAQTSIESGAISSIADSSIAAEDLEYIREVSAAFGHQPTDSELRDVRVVEVSGVQLRNAIPESVTAARADDLSGSIELLVLHAPDAQFAAPRGPHTTDPEGSVVRPTIAGDTVVVIRSTTTSYESRTVVGFEQVAPLLTTDSRPSS